jgi:hypothetical protein
MAQISTEWHYPVTIVAAFPTVNEARYVVKKTIVPAGKTRFAIAK